MIGTLVSDEAQLVRDRFDRFAGWESSADATIYSVYRTVQCHRGMLVKRWPGKLRPPPIYKDETNGNLRVLDKYLWLKTCHQKTMQPRRL